MKHQEIQKKYREILSSEHKGREIGRYYASELGSILNNWKKPEDFFKEKDLDEVACGNIDMGEALEAHQKKMWEKVGLKFEHEPKKEIEFEDFVIVVKPDFVFKDYIIETKAPTKRTLARYFDKGEIPYWYKPQLEAEMRAFPREKIYLGAFRDLKNNRFHLQLIEYRKDDELWEKVVKKLVKFDTKLKALNK